MISRQHRPNDLDATSKAFSSIKGIFRGVTKMLKRDENSLFII